MNHSPSRRLDATTVLVALVSVVSFGQLSDRIFGPAIDDLQRIAIAGLWVAAAIAALSRSSFRIRRPRAGSLLMVGTLLAYLTLSIFWSHDYAAGLAKMIVLLTVLASVYVVTATVGIEDVFRATTIGLTASLAISAVVATLLPLEGTMDTWAHLGKWAGIFNHKQTLGMVAALVIILTLLEPSGRRRPWFWSGIITLSILCLWQSASRGATIALLATLAILATMHLLRVAIRWRLLAISALFAAATTGVLVFAISGAYDLAFIGVDDDLSSRTLIWQFALGEWMKNPVQGVGLNSFWENPLHPEAFRQLYGWVIPNYHSGYVALLVETGLAGAALFLAMLSVASLQLRSLRSAPSFHVIVGVAIFIVIMNISETQFTRSTNGFQTLFLTIVFAAALGVPHFGRPWHDSQRASPLP